MILSVGKILTIKSDFLSFTERGDSAIMEKGRGGFRPGVTLLPLGIQRINAV